MYTSGIKKFAAAGLIAGVTLAAAAYAQTGRAPSPNGKNGPDKTAPAVKTGTEGAMVLAGPMNYSGTGTMNGHPYAMKCDMTPGGKPKGVIRHGMPGMSGMSGMMGKGSMATMGDMKMDKPMKMTGAMTMMGQTYQCSMTMTPQGK